MNWAYIIAIMAMAASVGATGEEWIKFLQTPSVNDKEGPVVLFFSLASDPGYDVKVTVSSNQLSIPKKEIFIHFHEWDKSHPIVVFPTLAHATHISDVIADFKVEFLDYGVVVREFKESKRVTRSFAVSGVCVSQGDPHIRTLDGFTFDNHNEGIFWLYKGHDLKVQESQYLCSQVVTPRGVKNAFCNNAFAVQYKGDAMIFAPSQYNDSRKGYVFYVPDGSNLKAARVANIGARGFAVIDKFTGENVAIIQGLRGGRGCGADVVMSITVYVKAEYAEKSEGMCGNFDRIPSNDNIYHGIRYSKRWELALASEVPKDENLFDLCAKDQDDSSQAKCTRCDFGYGPWIPGLPGFTMLDYLQDANGPNHPPQGYQWSTPSSWNTIGYKSFINRHENATCNLFGPINFAGGALGRIAKREDGKKLEPEEIGSPLDLAGGSFDVTFYAICEKSMNLLESCKGIVPADDFMTFTRECTSDLMVMSKNGLTLDVQAIQQIIQSYTEGLKEVCHRKVQAIFEVQKNADNEEEVVVKRSLLKSILRRRTSGGSSHAGSHTVAEASVGLTDEEVAAERASEILGLDENKCPDNCGRGQNRGACTDIGCVCFDGYSGLGCEKMPIATPINTPEQLLAMIGRP